MSHLLLFVLLLFTGSLFAADPQQSDIRMLPVIPSQQVMTEGQLKVAAFAGLLEDPQQQLTLEAVRERFIQGAWQAAHPGGINLGYSRSAWWVGFYLQANSHEPTTLLLELAFPSMDEVAFFAPQQTHPWITGDRHPFAQRPIRHRHFVFPVEVSGHEPQLVLLRLDSAGSLSVPLTLWQTDHFNHQSRLSYAGLAFYFGGLLALLAYNALLWLRMGERIYLDYVLFSGGLALGLAGFNGLGYEFLWPNVPWLAHLSFPVGFALCTLGVAQFTRSFLAPERISPLLDRILQAAAVFALLTAATLILFSYEIGAGMLTLVTVGTTLLALGSGIYCLLRGVPSARIYLLAWGIFLVFGIAFALRNHGLVPTNLLTLHGLLLGSMLGMLLLSFALADRIHAERSARERAQTAALLAQHDPLTGLPSRTLFSDRLQTAMRLADRNGSRLALIYLDLDHFKPVNDQYGHATGDALLKQVAQRIQRRIRESDTLARIGGDEFVVLLVAPDSLESALHLAENLRHSLSQPYRIHNHELHISASLGIALYPDQGQDEISLFKQADDAMYHAKRAGRDQVSVHQQIADA
jgi:two-component system, sensor histidine kinase LadS